jgi:hydroxymethylpyrimidine pyrophosphatase-like HAD family hydrolase
MNGPVAFCDLDDSLFQTRPKCPQDQSSGLRLMSRLADGSPSGYATVRQQNFLAWLRAGTIIPVTARSRSVLARVEIEQGPAICANGGCIIDADGNLDRDWHDRLVDEGGRAPAVAEVHAELTGDLSPADHRHWIVTEDGLDLYIVIKCNKGEVAELAQLGERLAARVPEGWRLHTNGNNVAFLPAWLNKRHAVAYLIERVRAENPGVPLIGIGDSHSDAGFMDLCDFAMTPTNSQLWSAATRGNTWLA